MFPSSPSSSPSQDGHSSPRNQRRRRRFGNESVINSNEDGIHQCNRLDKNNDSNNRNRQKKNEGPPPTTGSTRPQKSKSCGPMFSTAVGIIRNEDVYKQLHDKSEDTTDHFIVPTPGAAIVDSNGPSSSTPTSSFDDGHRQHHQQPRGEGRTIAVPQPPSPPKRAVTAASQAYLERMQEYWQDAFHDDSTELSCTGASETSRSPALQLRKLKDGYGLCQNNDMLVPTKKLSSRNRCDDDKKDEDEEEKAPYGEEEERKKVGAIKRPPPPQRAKSLFLTGTRNPIPASVAAAAGTGTRDKNQGRVREQREGQSDHGRAARPPHALIRSTKPPTRQRTMPPSIQELHQEHDQNDDGTATNNAVDWEYSQQMKFFWERQFSKESLSLSNSERTDMADTNNDKNKINEKGSSAGTTSVRDDTIEEHTTTTSWTDRYSNNNSKRSSLTSRDMSGHNRVVVAHVSDHDFHHHHDDIPEMIDHYHQPRRSSSVISSLTTPYHDVKEGPSLLVFRSSSSCSNDRQKQRPSWKSGHDDQHLLDKITDHVDATTDDDAPRVEKEKILLQGGQGTDVSVSAVSLDRYKKRRQRSMMEHRKQRQHPPPRFRSMPERTTKESPSVPVQEKSNIADFSSSTTATVAHSHRSFSKKDDDDDYDKSQGTMTNKNMEDSGDEEKSQQSMAEGYEDDTVTATAKSNEKLDEDEAKEGRCMSSCTSSKLSSFAKIPLTLNLQNGDVDNEEEAETVTTAKGGSSPTTTTTPGLPRPPKAAHHDDQKDGSRGEKCSTTTRDGTTTNSTVIRRQPAVGLRNSLRTSSTHGVGDNADGDDDYNSSNEKEGNQSTVEGRQRISSGTIAVAASMRRRESGGLSSSFPGAVQEHAGGGGDARARQSRIEHGLSSSLPGAFAVEGPDSSHNERTHERRESAVEEILLALNTSIAMNGEDGNNDDRVGVHHGSDDDNDDEEMLFDEGDIEAGSGRRTPGLNRRITGSQLRCSNRSGHSSSSFGDELSSLEDGGTPATPSSGGVVPNGDNDDDAPLAQVEAVTHHSDSLDVPSFHSVGGHDTNHHRCRPRSSTSGTQGRRMSATSYLGSVTTNVSVSEFHDEMTTATMTMTNVNAQLVDDAEPIFEAKDVQHDYFVRNLVLLFVVGLIICAFVVTLAVRLTRTMMNDGEVIRHDDPLCWVPLEEQSIAVRCFCSNTTGRFYDNEMNETARQVYDMYLNFVQEQGLFDVSNDTMTTSFNMDSCDLINQDLLIIANATSSEDPTSTRFSNRFRLALLTIIRMYTSMGGIKWTRNGNWLDMEVCGWDGITCLLKDWMYKFTLTENNLDGTLPTSIGYLNGLRVFDVSMNDDISGTLPTELGLMTMMQTLAISHTSIYGTIPSELGQLDGMDTMVLNKNQLSGTVPTDLFHLSNIRYLELANNQLTGTIPTEIGQSTRLMGLILGSNQFHGTLPTEMTHLSSLQLLSIGKNSFHGPIPNFLGTMSNLEMIYLHGSGFTGSIPETFCDHITNNENDDDDNDGDNERTTTATNHTTTTLQRSSNSSRHIEQRRRQQHRLLVVNCKSITPCSCCSMNDPNALISIQCYEDIETPSDHPWLDL